MKNVIFQYYLTYNNIGKNNKLYLGDDLPDWAQYSSNYFKKYAKLHNASYFLMRDRFVKSSSNYFEVLRLYLDPMFDEYDNLLYVDLDVMPKNFKENIFDLDVKDFAGFPEFRHPKLEKMPNWTATGPLKHRFEHFESKLVRPKTVDNPIRMLNSGVMIWTKAARIKARKMFIDHDSWFNYRNNLLDPKWKKIGGHSSHCLDQPFINAMVTRFNFDVLELDMKWNRFPTKDESYPCNFAHYTGFRRLRIPEIFEKI